MKNNLGIYIHIPFCKKKCDYCDFVSFPADEQMQGRYIDDLLKEVDLYGHVIDKANIATLYFGGGTPSVLPPAQLNKLLEGLPPGFFQAEEITFEMNPESVTEERLRILRESGINRISLGVQSLHEGTLQLLGRVHSAEDVFSAVNKIRAAGFFNLNLDLIYAVSENHPVEDSVILLAELQPEHISTYPLEIYEHLPLSNRLLPAEDALSVKEFSTIEQVLSGRGYKRYEISNFSKPGFSSKHNIAYWRRVDYLGLGASAHSFLGSCRHSNVHSLNDYHEALAKGIRPVFEEKVLTKEEEAFEVLMLGLRLTEGVDLRAYYANYGDFTPGQKKAIERFCSQGLLIQSESRLFLTSKGMNLMNVVLVELME